MTGFPKACNGHIVLLVFGFTSSLLAETLPAKKDSAPKIFGEVVSARTSYTPENIGRMAVVTRFAESLAYMKRIDEEYRQAQLSSVLSGLVRQS